MLTRRILIVAAVIAFAGTAQAQVTQAKMPVIATFSILGDIVSAIGGDRVMVKNLVGPNADAHVYSPSPADAKALAEAKVIVASKVGSPV